MKDDIDYIVTQQAARDGIYIGIEGGGTKSLKKYPHKEAMSIVQQYVGDNPVVETSGSRRMYRRRRAPAASTTQLNTMP